MNNSKQMIVVRKDLKPTYETAIKLVMRSSLKALLNYSNINIEDEKFINSKEDYLLQLRIKENSSLDNWIRGIFKKIVVFVNNKEELLEIIEKANSKKLKYAIEYYEKDPFVLSIGPYFDKEFENITTNLKLQAKSPKIKYEKNDEKIYDYYYGICVRTDLKMSYGKTLAQASHGFLATILDELRGHIPYCDFKPKIIDDYYILESNIKYNSPIDNLLKNTINYKEVISFMDNKSLFMYTYEDFLSEDDVPIQMIKDAALTELKEPTETIISIGPYKY